MKIAEIIGLTMRATTITDIAYPNSAKAISKETEYAIVVATAKPNKKSNDIFTIIL